jgi:hypothetical protein
MPEFVEDGQRLLPGALGRVEVSAGVVRVAEVGQGVRLVVAVADLPVPVDRLPVLAEQGVAPADRVERPDLPGRVVRRLEQAERLLGVAERLPVAALLVGNPAEVEVGVGLPGQVPEPAEQVERGRQVRDRVGVPPAGRASDRAGGRTPRGSRSVARCRCRTRCRRPAGSPRAASGTRC